GGVPERPCGRTSRHELANLFVPPQGRHMGALPYGVWREQRHECLDIPVVDRDRVALDEFATGLKGDKPVELWSIRDRVVHQPALVFMISGRKVTTCGNSMRTKRNST